MTPASYTGHQAAHIIADLPKTAPKPPLGPRQLEWFREHVEAFADLEARTKRAARNDVWGKP